jgi:hypothetical protein
MLVCTLHVHLPCIMHCRAPVLSACPRCRVFIKFIELKGLGLIFHQPIRAQGIVSNFS